MKTISLIFVLLLASGWAYGQDIDESQVPTKVVTAFKKAFANATDVEWERQGNQYQVEFEMTPHSDFDAWFDTSGKLLRHSEEITAAALPQAVVEAIRTNYAAYKIDDVKKITENKTETYAVELERGSEELNLIFSKNGKLVNPQ